MRGVIEFPEGYRRYLYEVLNMIDYECWIFAQHPSGHSDPGVSSGFETCGGGVDMSWACKVIQGASRKIAPGLFQFRTPREFLRHPVTLEQIYHDRFGLSP